MSPWLAKIPSQDFTGVALIIEQDQKTQNPIAMEILFKVLHCRPFIAFSIKDTDNIRIRSNPGTQIIFVFVFGPENTIRSPLI